MICDNMRLHGVTEEQLNIRAFPFSLKDAAKDWLYYQAPWSITNFKEVIFLRSIFLPLELRA